MRRARDEEQDNDTEDERRVVKPRVEVVLRAKSHVVTSQEEVKVFLDRLANSRAAYSFFYPNAARVNSMYQWWTCFGTK